MLFKHRVMFGKSKVIVDFPYFSLSPSCHPCHPTNRVYTSMYKGSCHPDTLFFKISDVRLLILFSQFLFGDKYRW